MNPPELPTAGEDTIVAVSTPPGRGGIGIVRVSGPRAREIVLPLVQLRRPLDPGVVRVGRLVDPDGGVLDEVVVTFHAAPHSYTTEHLVEVSTHGAPVLLQAVVEGCLRGGARLAEPGEFTRRAFLNGRLDLTQAEAVGDLVAASTLHQARVAAAQLGGALSRRVAPAKQQLVALIAELKAGVDFAEDDLQLPNRHDLAASIHNIEAPVTALADTFRYGQVTRAGFTLAIPGPVNVGKSSLFNRLVGRDRAIVTPEAGTTRDTIAEAVEIAGIPVELIDTAGFRSHPEGEAERSGIARSAEVIADADLVLHVLDATRLAEAPGAEPSESTRPGLVVVNKIDLMPSPTGGPDGALYCSARTGAGLETLEAAILKLLTGQNGPASAESGFLTTVRQHRSVAEAVAALATARAAANAGVPNEMLLLDLYTALGALDELTGATGTDEILGLIFSRFCIGK